MASNPPIANFHANGSLDLETRINRFLIAIEPHTRFFTAQGRTHLDSLIERDKKQDRALKADKSGWATLGFDQTTSLIDVAQGEDATGSQRSVTAMSSVSQRAGIRARMRDRYGNTSAMITAVRKVKLPAIKPKAKEPLAHVLATSSSSPIQAWKDIRPKSPAKTTPLRKVILEPVVEIPVYTSNGGAGGLDGERQSGADKHRTANSKKRKVLDNEPISTRSGNPKKSRHQDKCADEAKEVSLPKKDKSHPPKKAESRSLPLGESSTKINSATNRQDRKETDKFLPGKNLRSKTSLKSSKQQQASEKAEEQAREEILTARRDKRRKKMALKTTSVPADKKGKAKAQSPSSSAEVTDEDGDPMGREGSRHAKDNRDQKSKRERLDPSMALLKAYEVHGHLDRNRRITLPTPKLRLGLFGKGMISGIAGKTTQKIKHPPGLQFQFEKISKSKRKATSSPPTVESPEHSSTDEQSSLAPVKVRKAGTSKRKQIPEATVKPRKRPRDSIKADVKGASVSSRNEESREKSAVAQAEERQPSPDWPTILPEDNDQEENRDNKSQDGDTDNCEPLGPPEPQIEELESVGRAKTDTPPPPPLSESDIANQDPARLEAVPRSSLPLPEDAKVIGVDGPTARDNYDNSCSPSLDTRSFADILAEALAGPTSSLRSDQEDGGELLRMFEGSDRVPTPTNAENERAPCQNTDYNHDEAGETWSRPESVVERFRNVHDNGSCQARPYDGPEASLGSLDAVPQGSGMTYAMFPPENLPDACLDDQELDQRYSPALSCLKSAEANVVLEPELPRNPEYQALDIFGTDAERARQLLYGRR